MSKPLFELGRLVATPGALKAMFPNAEGLAKYLLDKHASGDWGDLDEHDKTRNDEAMLGTVEDGTWYGSRLISAYTVGNTKFWVITEADRSVTTILLPEEY